MRRRTNTALFALILGLVSGLPVLSEELSLEQILDKHAEAIGGKEAWLAVKSIRATGKMTMGPMEAPVTMIRARPNKLRVEFEVQGMKGIQAVDGDKGWMLMPFMGSTEPEPMPEEMLKEIATDIEIEGMLINSKEKGIQVALEGREDFEGTESYHLKATLPSDKIVHFYLDAEHFVPIGMKTKSNIQGMELDTTTSISDYKDVGGLMIAHAQTGKSQMGEQNVTLDKIEINVDVDDSIFAMPAKEVATPGAK